MLPSMSIEKRDPAIVNFMGDIFVIGGYLSGQYLNSVETYNPLTNRWTSVASMHEIRKEARAGVSGGFLYVVGGYDGTKWLSNIERYDHEINIWTIVRILKCC